MTAAIAQGSHGVPPGHSMEGPAPKRIVVGFGFWIFLLSDIVMFSAFFATYEVLARATSGGPGGAQLFHMDMVAAETACLLLSSFLCGLMQLSINVEDRRGTYIRGAATFLLGAAFLGLEIHEFMGMVAQGATPERSAFLSGFFTLVGCHGAHVTIGLIWLAVMMAQVRAKGFSLFVHHRLLCFSLFWHALDIIWVALFSIVYLMGMR